MKSKCIYAATALCMVAVCVALQFSGLGARSVRVHQHLSGAWQGAESMREDESPLHTHLPILQIDTGGQAVPGAPGPDGVIADDSRIRVSFSLTDGQTGDNSPLDPPTVSTHADIRYRGNSSRFFDKKSYSIHLVDENGAEDPQALAGMAAHDEWALNGPFLDRTLLRNYLCLNVAGEIMEYAPNVRYCELYLNGEYQGLYLLMETVSKGEGRIDIPTPQRNSDITSYIVRWDRAGKGSHELDNFSYYTYRSDVSALDLRYPGENQLTEGRLQYVQQDVSRVEKMLYSMDITDADNGLTAELDLASFAQYFVINEFFRNVDAGRFSTFYYRDARGKMKTCVWDFNNACDNYIDYQWDEAGFTMQNAPWFGALLRDERFVDAVVLEYHQLRRGVLSDEYLLNYIDETLLWLGDAIERNFSLWGYVFDLSQYNGMTYLTPVERNATSHAQAVEQLKRFIVERGAWLDAHIETLYQYCSDSKNVNLLAR